MPGSASDAMEPGAAGTRPCIYGYVVVLFAWRSMGAANVQVVDGMLRSLRTYPLTAYFILAYLLSWGGVVAIVGPFGFPGEGDDLPRLLPFVFAAQALGPPLAALILTAAIDGRPGLAALFRRMIAVRVDWRSWVVAAGLVPGLVLLVLLVFSLFDSRYLPGLITGGSAMGGVLPLLALGVAGGPIAGFLEEIGWTGFAADRVPGSWSLLQVAAVIGVLHGVWHLAPGFWGDYARWESGLYFAHFLIFWIGGLTALRVVIVWLFRRTLSLPVAQLAHASYTGGMLILWPAATAIEDFRWTAVFVLLLWLAALAIATRRAGA